MIVIAYRGGYKKGESKDYKKGSYGFKISITDRDQYFHRDWNFIILELNGEKQSFQVNINKNSFWDSGCRELISSDIKKWFFKNKVIPWESGRPPRINLENINGNRFVAQIL